MEDFRDAAVVEAGLSRDVSRRETGLAGSLEALAARGARFLPLLLRALERGLEASHLGAGLLLVGGVRDCGSLRAVAATVRSSRHEAAAAGREMRPECDHAAPERLGIAWK